MNRIGIFFSAVVLLLGTPATQALEVGDIGPCVVLEDIQPDGSTKDQCIRTPRVKGQHVLLEFFSPVCEDCVENLHNLNVLAKDTYSTATTRMVGIDKSKPALLKFIQDHLAQIDVPVSLDLERQAQRAYGVTSIPVLFVLNSKNRIVYKHTGVLTPESEAAIKQLVK